MEDRIQALLQFFETHKHHFTCTDAHRYVSALQYIKETHADEVETSRKISESLLEISTRLTKIEEAIANPPIR